MPKLDPLVLIDDVFADQKIVNLVRTAHDAS